MECKAAGIVMLDLSWVGGLTVGKAVASMTTSAGARRPYGVSPAQRITGMISSTVGGSAG